MANRKTHFEQVPLETIERLLHEEKPPAKKKPGHIVPVERPSSKTEPYSVHTAAWKQFEQIGAK